MWLDEREGHSDLIGVCRSVKNTILALIFLGPKITLEYPTSLALPHHRHIGLNTATDSNIPPKLFI
ncbi:hypothetical protein N7537_006829 [Penicillium hordei]|uniref:Uncharacterized protein n=1 Tax=Penicillium hordei TaxID=40994 RepID=A0AAD6E8L1_9EURO|nr:uncharacterized protein N7537_006829 [Penicillium hordei]KAJ5603873.1 hypothetical protein N7537_006829 [Penicillium hordei]